MKKHAGPHTRRDLLVLAVVCIITFFVHNRVIYPDIMEARNIVAAREMAGEGHWLSPTMNGEPRLEKPPLPTWITALAESAAPGSLALERGAAGAAAVVLVFFFYAFAVGMRFPRPLISTLLLCTCYNLVLMGRTASWDIYCHAFMLGAIFFLSRALRAPQCRWGDFVAGGVMAGLSLLSKGPVSLYALLLPFLLSWALCFRTPMRGKRAAAAVAVAVMLAVGLWWYLYLWLSDPGTLAVVAGKESGAWMSHNVRPWWYYWTFPGETGVWALLLPTALLLPLWAKEVRRDRNYLFPVLWMAAMLVLLSLLPEKKNRYLLPVLIPASYAMGYLAAWWNERFRQGTASGADRWSFRINAWGVTLAVAATVPAAWLFLRRPGHIPLPAFVLLCAAVAVAVSALGRAAVRLRPFATVGWVAGLFLAAECFALPLMRPLFNNPRMKSIAETCEVEALDGVPFYHDLQSPLRIELVYAAGRKIRPLNLSDTEALQGLLPCALLTHRRVGEVLPGSVWSQVDSLYVGRYDDNRWAPTHRRYSDDFRYHVTLLTAKPRAGEPAGEGERRREREPGKVPAERAR